MNYFEFNERRTRHAVPQRVIAGDVIEWPDIVVTESEPDDDQLLEFSLQAGAVNIPKGDNCL